MKRLLGVLVLLLLVTASTMALADSPSGTSPGSIEHIRHFADNLAPPESDYSVAYLGQIFGTMGNVLHSTSGQILGKMFDIFNKGVLIIAALWLGMTTLQIAVRATQDGSFMGQNRNTMLTMLRIALGFSLIIPSSTTGYSLIQEIFMKVVVQSVGLADKTWDTALHYLQYGGSLYIPPNTLSSDKDIVSNYMNKSTATTGTGNAANAPGFVAQIFQNEVCMIASKTWEQNSMSQTQGGTGAGTSITTSGAYVDYQPVYDEKHGVVYFPGIGNSSVTNLSTSSAKCGYALDYYHTQRKASPPSPGTYHPTTEQQAMEQSYSFSALKQVVLSLMPAAQAYVDAYNASPKQSTRQNNELLASNGKIAFSAILAYVNLITPYQQLLSRQASSVDFADAARKEGWIMAGSFYWSVEQANAYASTLSVGSLLPETGGPSSTITSATDQANLLNSALQGGSDTYKNLTNCNGVDPGTASSTPGIQVSTTCIAHLWSEYVGAVQNSTQSPDQASQGSFSVSGVMGFVLSKVLAIGFGGGTAYNPIAVLMHLGTVLLEVVVAVWFGAVALTVLLAAAAGICASTSPGFLMTQVLVNWIKSILMGILGVLLIPGAIMAYYIPLYPFAVFTFAAVGWFIIVIEGLAAAPLICINVTHPDGHEFLGKGEQLLMLFVSIFVRPTLMIIGLIAAMVLSFVAFHMLYGGFQGVMASLVKEGGSLGNPLLILISICMVLVIFGMMTMELIEQCFKLIYQLPNYMNKWIGASSTGEEYGQMAQQLKGGASSTAGSIKAGAEGSVDGSTTRGLREWRAAKDKKGGGGKLDVQ